MDQTSHHNTFLSILFACTAFFLFSAADVCVKYFSNLGYSNHIMLTYSSAIAFTIAFVYILIQKGPKGFKPVKPIRLHIIRMLSLTIGTIAIVYALEYMPLTEFYAIVFLIPFCIALSTGIILKEEIGPFRWIAICGGFLGAIISISGNLSNPAEIPFIGIVYSVATVIFISGSYLVIRKMGHGEYTPLFPLYAQISIFVFNIWFALPDLVLPPMSEWLIWIIYGGSIFGAVMLVSSAYTLAPVAAIPAPFQYTQIIWGLLFGIFLFNESPEITTLIGIAIIITSGLFMIWQEYLTTQRRKKTQESIVIDSP